MAPVMSKLWFSKDSDRNLSTQTSNESTSEADVDANHARRLAKEQKRIVAWTALFDSVLELELEMTSELRKGREAVAIADAMLASGSGGDGSDPVKAKHVRASAEKAMARSLARSAELKAVVDGMMQRMLAAMAGLDNRPADAAAAPRLFPQIRKKGSGGGLVTMSSDEIQELVRRFRASAAKDAARAARLAKLKTVTGVIGRRFNSAVDNLIKKTSDMLWAFESVLASCIDRIWPDYYYDEDDGPIAVVMILHEISYTTGPDYEEPIGRSTPVITAGAQYLTAREIEEQHNNSDSEYKIRVVAFYIPGRGRVRV